MNAPLLFNRAYTVMRKICAQLAYTPATSNQTLTPAHRRQTPKVNVHACAYACTTRRRARTRCWHGRISQYFTIDVRRPVRPSARLASMPCPWAWQLGQLNAPATARKLASLRFLDGAARDGLP